jgi:hypothetical protein
MRQQQLELSGVDAAVQPEILLRAPGDLPPFSGRVVGDIRTQGFSLAEALGWCAINNLP